MRVFIVSYGGDIAHVCDTYEVAYKFVHDETLEMIDPSNEENREAYIYFLENKDNLADPVVTKKISQMCGGEEGLELIITSHSVDSATKTKEDQFEDVILKRYEITGKSEDKVCTSDIIRYVCDECKVPITRVNAGGLLTKLINSMGGTKMTKRDMTVKGVKYRLGIKLKPAPLVAIVA